MYDELSSILVVGDGCLHLHGVVSVAELGEAEAANSLEAINLIKEIIVTTVVKSKACASEKVHLDSVFNGLRGIN